MFIKWERAERSVCSGKFNESVKNISVLHTSSSYWINLAFNGDEGGENLRLHLKISVIQMANLPHGNAYREAGAQPVLVCHLPASGKGFFYLFIYFLLIAQSVSMKLTLYVRLYTNWHVSKKEYIFTFPIKKKLFSFPTTLNSSKVLSTDTVEKLMTGLLESARSVL